MARRKQESREVWAERVAAWRASGLTGNRYAEQHDLKASSLYHWGKVLGGEASTPRRGFAQVVVRSEAPTASGLEVVLGNGRVVRILGAVDGDHLQAVVTALESC